MEKAIVAMLIIANVLCIGSCDRYYLYDDSGQKADVRLEAIIDAINSKDEDYLKLMFSERALDEAKNIDEQINSLLMFVNEKIVASNE